MKTAILACAASLFRQPSVARRVARIGKLRRHQQVIDKEGKARVIIAEAKCCQVKYPDG